MECVKTGIIDQEYEVGEREREKNRRKAQIAEKNSLVIRVMACSRRSIVEVVLTM